MSTFNIIGFILLAVVVIVGVILKIILSRRRGKLEGVHGFIDEDRGGEGKFDDWKSL